MLCQEVQPLIEIDPPEGVDRHAQLAQGAFPLVQPVQERQALLELPPQDRPDLDWGGTTAGLHVFRTHPSEAASLANRLQPVQVAVARRNRLPGSGAADRLLA